MLINRHIACPNCVWSCDMFDNQALGRSYVILPGSYAVRSHDMLVIEGSHDLSCDRSYDRFPQSCVLRVTWLELELGAVVKQLVTVRWVLGLFGNVFLVGVSFAHNSIPSLGSPCTCKAHMCIPSLGHRWAWEFCD